MLSQYPMRPIAYLIALLGILTASALTPATAQADERVYLPLVHTVFMVTTTEDELNNDGDVSLREAIQAANLKAAGSYSSSSTVPITATTPLIVIVPAGYYTLTLAGAGEDANATGDLDVTGALVLYGAGEGQTIIDGNQLDRVFDIHTGATVTLLNLTIRNGKAEEGAPGVDGPGAKGADGGGIANDGTLTLTTVSLLGNTAGKGGDGIGPRPNYTAGGDGGRGGAIFNSGQLVIRASQVISNTAGVGGSSVTSGGLGVCPQSGGNGGHGGAIYNQGTALLTEVKLVGNTAGSAGSGFSSDQYGGSGGGLYNEGDLTLVASSVSNNKSGHGGGGVCYPGNAPEGTSFGFPGAGGGIFNTGTLEILFSTINNNTTAGGGSIFTSHGGCPRSGGEGGGIANTSTLTVTLSTVSGNHTGNGGTSLFCSAGAGSGAGIQNTGQALLLGVTISNNITGDEAQGGTNRGGSGGGIFTTSPVRVKSTLIAGNQATAAGPDCIGVLASTRYNLIGDLAGCAITENEEGNLYGVSPALAALGDNGGPTLTHALLPESPAIDASSCLDTHGQPLPVDQRGVSRPQGVACDIGAFELVQ